MNDQEDPGKALLRLLHGQAPPVPLPPTNSHNTQISEFHPPPTFLPLPATEVRMAAGGGYSDPSAPQFSHNLSRPRVLTTSVPRSAGADLLRMLHQGSTSPAGSSSTMVTPSTATPGLPPPPPPSVQAPPISTPRSIAAEQERILKNFLSIGGNESSSVPCTPSVQQILPPPPPPARSPVAHSPLASTVQAPSTAPMTNGEVGGNGKKNNRRGKRSESRGKGARRKQQVEHPESGDDFHRGIGDPGRPAAGAGDCHEASPRHLERSRSASTSRRRSGSNQGGKNQGRGKATHAGDSAHDNVKNGKGGGKTRRGTRGGGSPPSQQPIYALSAFQTSPDPKSIPIPSLQCFSFDREVSGGSQQVEASSSPSWHGGNLGSPAEEVVVTQQALTHASPTRDVSAKTAGRSSAQKIEDDIKRILRLS